MVIGNWARSQDGGEGKGTQLFKITSSHESLSPEENPYSLCLNTLGISFFLPKCNPSATQAFKNSLPQRINFLTQAYCPMPNALSLAAMSDAAIYGLAFFYTLVLRGFYSTGAKMRVVNFDYVLPRFSTFVAELDRSD